MQRRKPGLKHFKFQTLLIGTGWRCSKGGSERVNIDFLKGGNWFATNTDLSSRHYFTFVLRWVTPCGWRDVKIQELLGCSLVLVNHSNQNSCSLHVHVHEGCRALQVVQATKKSFLNASPRARTDALGCHVVGMPAVYVLLQTQSTVLRQPSSKRCHNWLRHRSRKTVS